VTSIDCICTNKNIDNLTTEVIHAGLSDHTAQTCVLHILDKVQEPGVVRRQLNARNLLDFKLKLQQESWKDVLQAASAEEAYNHFLCKLKLALETTCLVRN